MEYRLLGGTGLRVSRLCFGALTIGPLQAGLSPEEGARVIRSALELGVNFIDTAELYGTYEHIRLALRGWPDPVVIATKSYAYTREGMRESLDRARRALGRECLELFLLHEQESAETIRGHWPALEYLLEAKAKGWVRAVGISTHWVGCVRAASRLAEVEVIHPLINRRGLGIQGGSREEMLEAIREAARAGKGIYAMKALGGGLIREEVPASFAFLLAQPEIAAVAVGMRSVEEVRLNVHYFAALGGEGGAFPPEEVAAWERKVAAAERRLVMDEGCTGCGSCVQCCPQGALTLVGGQVRVEAQRCILCGYCGAACPRFLLRIV
ncbi:MAG: aldo/keto reductase [Bacillota bacterium]|nr:aldo/keto reductase [Bacillota bacterium]